MREKLLDFFKKKYIGYEGKTYRIVDFGILTKEQHDKLPKADKFMMRNRDWIYVVIYEHIGEKSYEGVAKFLSSLEARFSVEDGFRMTDNIAVLNYTEKIQESRSLIQQVLREQTDPEAKFQKVKKYLVGKKIKLTSDMMRSGFETEVTPSYMIIKDVFLVMEKDPELKERKPVFSAAFLVDVIEGEAIIGGSKQTNFGFAVQDTMVHIMDKYFNYTNVYPQNYTNEQSFLNGIEHYTKYGWTVYH